MGLILEQEYNQYSSNDFTDKEFVVYSDRNENFLYDDINGKKNKTKSGKKFMQHNLHLIG